MSLRFHRGSLSNSWISIPKMSKNVSGAKWRWKGRAKGEKTKEGKSGGVFVVSTRLVKEGVMTKMTGSNGFSPHIPFEHKSHLWKQLNWQQMQLVEEVQRVGLGERYLQSGSVHVSRQFSSPSTGYHEHFIGVHLQREIRVSGHVTPACWCELSVNTSFNKLIIIVIEEKTWCLFVNSTACDWGNTGWESRCVTGNEGCSAGSEGVGGMQGATLCTLFRWRHVQ